MQGTNIRYLILTIVLLAGAGLYAVLGEPLGVGTPRWPTSDAVYEADSWSMEPLQVEKINTAYFITRVYHNASGANVTLTIETYQSPKLYAAGPEVPYLGSGYTVFGPPAGVPASADGIGALQAAQGSDTWLVMYAYGERRGLLGNGPVAWTFAVTDGLLGRPNDYFKLYLTARSDPQDTSLPPDLAELAHTVFPHIQQWYGA